ncbi:MAG: hypothetical protein WCD79_08190, partial [Chthoniobacteraceae bacterium]
MRTPPETPKQRRASALAIILAIITLITLLVLTFLGVAQYERTSSNLSLGRVQSESLADFAADTAIIKLREAIAAGTYVDSSGSIPNSKTWASMPGRIAVFDLTQARPNNVTFYDIFSGTAGADDPVTPDLNNVDLNKPSVLGEYPIAMPSAGATAANMKVGWINVLADSGTAASKSNPIVGRIAYWMDDETCKVNINTADGSHKTDLNPDGSVADGSVTGYPAISASGTVGSYGFGTPSEISLAALPTASGTLSGTSIAAAIAAYASGTASGANAVNNTVATITGFNSAAEVGRAFAASGSSPVGYYKTNKFNITHTSKSPDLNMFGEPRINLFPVLPVLSTAVNNTFLAYQGGGTVRSQISGPSGSYAWESPIDWGAQFNATTFITAPINFIYPLSAQLPPVKIPAISGSALPQYPSGFTAPAGNFNDKGGTAFTLSSTSSFANYNLGTRIASYLSGTNSQNQQITWPDYGTGSKGSTAFTKKYNTRQIDSITLQMLDMVGQDMSDEGRGYSLPTVMFKGFLSGTLVSGFGRSPKLTALYLSLTASTSNAFVPGYTAVPFVELVFGNIQFYFPRYFTGNPMHTPYMTDVIDVAGNGANSATVLNFPDMPGYNGGSGTPPLNQINHNPGSFGGFW